MTLGGSLGPSLRTTADVSPFLPAPSPQGLSSFELFPDWRNPGKGYATPAGLCCECFLPVPQIEEPLNGGQLTSRGYPTWVLAEPGLGTLASLALAWRGQVAQTQSGEEFSALRMDSNQ